MFFMSLVLHSGVAQVRKISKDSVILKGIVVEEETNTPIARVNVETNNGAYTTTNGHGEFSILVEIGDELSIKSDAFRTVYYTIKDQQKITIKVQSINDRWLEPANTSKFKKDLFSIYIDSANVFLKTEQELSHATRFNKEIALKQNRITSLENERELNESRYKLAFENQNRNQKNNRVQQWIIGSLVLIALLLW